MCKSIGTPADLYQHVLTSTVPIAQLWSAFGSWQTNRATHCCPPLVPDVLFASFWIPFKARKFGTEIPTCFNTIPPGSIGLLQFHHALLGVAPVDFQGLGYGAETLKPLIALLHPSLNPVGRSCKMLTSDDSQSLGISGNGWINRGRWIFQKRVKRKTMSQYVTVAPTTFDQLVESANVLAHCSNNVSLHIKSHEDPNRCNNIIIFSRQDGRKHLQKLPISSLTTRNSNFFWSIFGHWWTATKSFRQQVLTSRSCCSA